MMTRLLNIMVHRLIDEPSDSIATTKVSSVSSDRRKRL
jgi:hypothetical protein